MELVPFTAHVSPQLHGRRSAFAGLKLISFDFYINALSDVGAAGLAYQAYALAAESAAPARPPFRRRMGERNGDQFAVRCKSPAGQLPCRIGSCMPLVALTTSALTRRNTLSSSMPGVRKASINAFA